MRFDATVKGIVEAGPDDWVAMTGQRGKAEIIDADVSTVSAATDKVLRVRGARGRPDWLSDINFQSGPDASVPRRTHLYNTLLEERHELLVRSTVILLAPKANLKAIDGTFRCGFAGEEPYRTFRYQVIRVWELPVEGLLEGGLATLPLAPISNVTERNLPGVIGRMRERLGAPRAASLAGGLWAATEVLMGLRYEQALVDRLLEGIQGMEESVTYQAIVRKGAAAGIEEARATLLQLGTTRFGRPNARTTKAIETMMDVHELHGLIRRVLDVDSWEELLPSLRASKRKRTS